MPIRRGVVVLFAWTVALVGALSAIGALGPTSVAAQTPEPPPAGLGVTLLQGPPGAVDDPRAHTYVIDHLAPGTTISREVGFSNGETEPMDVTFYATAARVDDGSFTVDAGRAANDVSGWTTFSPVSATLLPGQTLPVTLTISVPADAPSGERYGAALGERTVAPAASGGVASVSRVGIRLYLSVGPGEEPVTSFSIDTMTAGRDASGRPIVEAQVHNTGQRAVDLSGDLRLSNGPSALSAGPFPVGTVATLLPGESGPVLVGLDESIPSGPWDAVIRLTSGVTSEQGAATITFPEAEETMASSVPVVPVDGGGRAPFPTELLAIVGAAATLAAAGASVFVQRSRRGRRIRRAPAPVPVPMS